MAPSITYTITEAQQPHSLSQHVSKINVGPVTLQYVTVKRTMTCPMHLTATIPQRNVTWREYHQYL